MLLCSILSRVLPLLSPEDLLPAVCVVGAAVVVVCGGVVAAGNCVAGCTVCTVPTTDERIGSSVGRDVGRTVVGWRKRKRKRSERCICVSLRLLSALFPFLCLTWGVVVTGGVVVGNALVVGNTDVVANGSVVVCTKREREIRDSVSLSLSVLAHVVPAQELLWTRWE